MRNLIKLILFIVLLLTMNLCFFLSGYFRGQKTKTNRNRKQSKRIKQKILY